MTEKELVELLKPSIKNVMTLKTECELLEEADAINDIDVIAQSIRKTMYSLERAVFMMKGYLAVQEFINQEDDATL